MKQTILSPLSLLCLLIVSLSLYSCQGETQVATGFNYGTQSDSARFYFNEGWREIMDNGRWTESEVNFRKAMEFDPAWLVGKSLVGRITRDLTERQQLLTELEEAKPQTTGGERLLLDIFMPSMIAMNNRDLGIRSSAEAGEQRRAQSETNFRAFVHQYPEESYIKAEYIETLHANHGARVALDSLNLLSSMEQKLLPFFISYTATMELELGHFDKAQALANTLDKTLTDVSYTSPMMLRAQIYMAQDSLQKASALVNKVVMMDPNHLIALGMKSRIDKALVDQ
jgi:tetratricopeptide (TPR) repeat protein